MNQFPSESTGEDAPPSLLHNRNFILLWCAYAVSAMGDHLSEMAILKTQDALNPNVDITPLSARMSFAFFVPFLLLAPIAGVLADRLPRRLVMISADVARGLLMMCFATMIAWTQDWGSWGPFLPLVTIGTFAAIFSPARSALLPTLVNPAQLVRANGLISGLGIIASMAAALVGGYLADRYAPTVAFRADAVTFALSAVFLLLIRVPARQAYQERRGSGDSLARQLFDGCRYVAAHRRVVELLAIASIVWFCGSLVNSVIPAVVRDSYDGTYATISAYRAYLGLGFLVGAVIIAALGSSLRSEIAMNWGLFGLAFAMAIFASSIFLPMPLLLRRSVGAVGIGLGGLFAVSTMASFNTLLQRTVADRYRGRIFGLKDLACTGSLLVAMGLLGTSSWIRIDRFAGHILIGVSLFTAAAGTITWVTRLRRSVHGTAMGVAQNINEFLCKTWWRLERIGRPTLPREGAVILAANHTCSADPNLLLAAATYRPVSFMIAVEYTNSFIVRFFAGLLDCIPVKRDGQDIAATKMALRHLRAGKAIGIFMEGRIVPPGEHIQLKDGVALLALKTGATVIPAHISGITYRKGIVKGLLTRHRARVRFGPPVDLGSLGEQRSDKAVVRLATERIYDAIQALAPSTSDAAKGDVMPTGKER